MEPVISEKLEKAILDVITKIESNKGLKIFAENRSKFEGWFKVELITALTEFGFNAIPERDRIDVTIDDEWAIELKTVNTPYKKYPGDKYKSRPLSKNVKSVIKDIDDLKTKKKYINKAVIFIVFPYVDNKFLDSYQEDIEKKLSHDLKDYEFTFFESEIKGCLFWGYID